MKRIIAILLLFIYSLTSFGVSATIHFCGDKIASLQLLDKSEPQSCCKGKPGKRKCCHSAHFELKSCKSDQRASLISKTEKPTASTKFIDTRPIAATSAIFPKSTGLIHHPFLNYKVPIHLQLRVLVI